MRTIARHRVYALINVSGLALGLCVCMSIFLLCSYELSFDSFHRDGDRIYRINNYMKVGSGSEVRIGAGKLPDDYKKKIPGLAALAGYYKLAVDKEGPTAAVRTIVTTSAYFDIMGYQWLAGSAPQALDEPNTVVLTSMRAEQYFGAMPAPEMIGKVVTLNDSLHLRVAGVVRDWQGNTDFPFTCFVSRGTFPDSLWDEAHSAALCKLGVGVAPAAVDTVLALLSRHGRAYSLATLRLEALRDVHYSDQGGTAHRPTLYALLAIGVFILILAIVNYINLATAQSMQRIKETAIRKVLGSGRASIMLQFLMETFLLTLFSAVLACLFVRPVLGMFRELIPTQVRFDPMQPATIGFVVGIVVVTTFLAGLYPAGVLAGYKAVNSLKGGRAAPAGAYSWGLRRALTVFQFTVSLSFIVAVLVIGDQIHYMRHTDLGFSSDGIVNFNTNDKDSLSKVKLLAERIRRLPGVSGAALENIVPMSAGRSILSLQPDPGVDDRKVVSMIVADEHYIPLYQIKLLAGTNLSPSDTMREFVINETLARSLGYMKPKEAIGRVVYWRHRPWPITGVVADFHEASFHESIAPLVLTQGSTTEVAVKLDIKGKQAADARAIMARIRWVWEGVYAHEPFEYEFLDGTIAELYSKEITTAWLMNIAAGIAIYISCMGLLGLSMFVVERRTKEIGIRKVLGATVGNIAVLLSRDLVFLIFLALLIATPIAWWGMSRWLRDFVYRVPVHWWLFLLAGVGGLAIALLTIGFHTLRAARANPVVALRSE